MMKRRTLSFILAVVLVLSLTSGMTLRAEADPTVPSPGAGAVQQPETTEQDAVSGQPEKAAAPTETTEPAEDQEAAGDVDDAEDQEVTGEQDDTEDPEAAGDTDDAEDPEETPDPENGGVSDEEEPEDESGVMALGLENEIAPIEVDEFEAQRLDYWASGALLTPALNAKKVVSLTMKKGFSTLEGYSFELTVNGTKVDLGEAKLHRGNSSSDFVWWDNVELTQGGNYTLTVKKDGAEITSAKAEIYKVTFNPGEGHFADQAVGAPFVAYGMQETRWEKYGLPASPKRDSDGDFNGFLGWAATEEVTGYEGTAGNLAGILSSSPASDYNVTVHAAYGVQKVYRLEPWYNGASAGDTLDLEFGLGTEQTFNLYIKNVGNQTIPKVRLLSGIRNYTMTVNRSLEELKAGESISLTLKPNNLGVGSYTDSLIVNTIGTGSDLTSGFSLAIKTTVIGTRVTVTPEARTKYYGDTIDPSKVSCEVKTEAGQPLTLSQIGATLQSQGFAANAEAGEYEYTLRGGSGYTITLDNSKKVTVEPATPTANGVNATGIYAGEPLSKSTLSGSFTNPYTNQTVTGELKWDDAGQTVNESGYYNWTFTPADTTNYTTVSGTAHVAAGKGTPTEIILESQTTFQYNGRPQGLRFTTDRKADDTTPIVVQYEVDGQWTTEVPKNVGTYRVEATIASTPEYEGDEHSETLTITAAPVKPNFNVFMAKTYDGTTNAHVEYTYMDGRFGNDDVGVKFDAAYETKDAGRPIIVITYDTLTGEDAGNYYLANNVRRESGLIYTRAIKITADNIEKEYGEELTLTGDMFTATGLANGEKLADQHVDYASAGTASAAEVGTYPVTARAHGGNYTTGSRNNAAPVDAPAGEMKVIPATPVAADGGVTAGEGQQGGKLGDVALSGSFVNPHNHSMLVEGTLEWEDPDTRLPGTESTEATWKFTPSDKKNYTGTLSGQVTITLLSLPTVQVTANNKTVEYDGQPHGIDAPEVAAGFENTVALEIEYRLHKDIVTTIALENAGGHDDFTTEEPVNAGTYDVHVHVNVLPAFATEFADDLLQPTLIITPRQPDVTGVTVKGEGGTAVPEGTVLADVELTGATGLGGTELTGTFTWEHPLTAVTEDGDFPWTFTPDDSNYAPVSGSIHLTLAEDTRTIEAAVYNLPAGYGDYAVVDVAKSELKAGDVIVFYKDGTDPVCEPVTITQEDVDAGTLTVELDDDALDADGGILTTSISNSSQHTPDQVTYKPEMGFIVPEVLITYAGHSEILDIIEAEGYEVLSVSISANADDFVSVEHGPEIDAVIHALRAGSTTLEVALTFAHPDPAKAGVTITISKTVYVAVEPAMGDLEITKTVTGSEGDTSKYFTFTVTLTEQASAAAEGETGGDTEQETEPETVTYGDITFTDGVAVIKLKHGERVTIPGIPEGTGYTVTESDNEGYTVTKTGDSDVIEAGVIAKAAFTNTKGAAETAKPTTTGSGGTTAPKTGDGSMPGLWLALLAMGVGGLAVCGTQLRRKKRSR